MTFVPVATSEAGLCLTPADWIESGVTSLSWSLESLLVKPGINLLNKIPDIRRYLGWSGFFILNAAKMKANREGNYTVTSPFDGSKIRVSSAELIDLIRYLNPDAVILPDKMVEKFPEIWTHWSDSIKGFVHETDLNLQDERGNHGIYYHFDKSDSSALSSGIIMQSPGKELQFIESDEPAKNAMHGKVYSQSGIIDLTNTQHAMDFERLDPECPCPTCSQQLTRAYLHHLLLHTPLLAQRFLIQHNVAYSSY